MKKLVSLILAMVFSASLFTACSKGTESNSTGNEVTPSPSPVVDETENTDEPPVNHETVTGMWSSFKGYWAAADGGYAHFTYDDDGIAVVCTYDKRGTLVSVYRPKLIMASNKSSYVMEVEYPAIANDEKYPGLTQDAKSVSFVLDISGLADGFMEVAANGEKAVVYASVGDSLEKLADGVARAKKLAK